jgi:translation initiation factor RLI1
MPMTRGEIVVRISGYNNVSKETGIKYLGLSIEPDYKTQKLIEEKLAASGAAQSLAAATDGVVVAVNDDDLF